jgi:hypothetical protein
MYDIFRLQTKQGCLSQWKHTWITDQTTGAMTIWCPSDTNANLSFKTYWEASEYNKNCIPKHTICSSAVSDFVGRMQATFG